MVIVVCRRMALGVCVAQVVMRPSLACSPVMSPALTAELAEGGRALKRFGPFAVAEFRDRSPR